MFLFWQVCASYHMKSVADVVSAEAKLIFDSNPSMIYMGCHHVVNKRSSLGASNMLHSQCPYVVEWHDNIRTFMWKSTQKQKQQT